MTMYARILKRVPGYAGAVAFAFLALACAGAQAQAQSNYPDHPVRMIVPYPPGGSMDIVTRVLAKALGESMKQSFVVENRAGASGAVGNAYIAKAAPDGYTIGMGAPTLVSAQYLNSTLPYSVKELTPIIWVINQPNVLLIHPSVPANNLKEFIDYLQANPGKVSFGSYGVGGSQHLAAELFMMMSKTKMVHVPYTRTSALTDLVGGQIQMMIDAVTTGLPYVKSGQLKALGVTTMERSAMMPDVPTMSEAGLKGYDYYGFNVLMAPAGTPKAVIDKLNQETNKALKDPAVRKTLEDQGLQVVGGSVQDAIRNLKEQDEMVAKIVKEAHIEPAN
jgi:tripartite-type tricarboxylate transporter receptor subunit TctC